MYEKLQYQCNYTESATLTPRRFLAVGARIVGAAGRSACREKPVLAAECFPINMTTANLTGSSPECVLPAQGKNNTATFASY